MCAESVLFGLERRFATVASPHKTLRAPAPASGLGLTCAGMCAESVLFGLERRLATVASPHKTLRGPCSYASGATFTTSSVVVTPAATFAAPETRNGFMPSL